jgi:hypothetical protein
MDDSADLEGIIRQYLWKNHLKLIHEMEEKLCKCKRLTLYPACVYVDRFHQCKGDTLRDIYWDYVFNCLVKDNPTVAMEAYLLQ